MKYAFMSFSCPDLSLQEMLDAAQRFGYDGVEARVAAGHAHGLETDAGTDVRSAARQTIASSGVPVVCIATSCRFADPANCDEHVEETLRAVDLAADVGAGAVRVFGGKIPDGVSREEAVEGVAVALLRTADRAAERGVTVCLETHDDWCDPADVAAVMRRVDHPAIRVNWDIMHPVRTGKATMAEAFEALKAWVAHVHFHDGRTEGGRLTMVPVGEGEIDHREAVRLLAEMPFTGYLSGEWINWEPWQEHLPRELRIMKLYEHELSAD